MMAILSEEIKMPFFFRKKEQLRLEEIQLKEVKIEKYKEKAETKYKETTEAMRKLNELVEEHGASAVLYVAMGGEVRK